MPSTGLNFSECEQCDLGYGSLPGQTGLLECPACPAGRYQNGDSDRGAVTTVGEFWAWEIHGNLGMTGALINIIHEYLMHNYTICQYDYEPICAPFLQLALLCWQKKSTENTAHNHGQKENVFLEVHRKMISHVH